MSETDEPGVTPAPDGESRHSQDPAEGADAPEPDQPRVHSQDPAEGADDDPAQ
jgi:hypothetical protein